MQGVIHLLALASQVLTKFEKATSVHFVSSTDLFLLQLQEGYDNFFPLKERLGEA